MYKEIELKYEDGLDEKDRLAIQSFNDAFGDKEIKLECDDHRLTILLREIDFERVKDLSARLAASTDKTIFRDVVDAIEKIKSYGVKKGKRNYVNYNDERKVKDRKQKEEKRSQYYYARDHNFSKTETPMPDEFLNRIWVGDSESLLKKLPDNSVDLVFTSPPYNFGLEYTENQDDHYWEDYFSKLFRIFKECIRVTKYGGRIIINVQPLFSDYIPSHHLISQFFIKEKLIWKGEILWEKNNYNCKYTAWGSWQSPSSPYLKYTWEFLEIFCKGDLKKNGARENVDISASEFKKWVVAKWSIAPARNMKTYGHPAMFPEELVKRVLKLFSFKGDIVLDPFNGVGTTTVVAERLGRHYIGIDISETYCEIARKRLQN